MNQRKDIFAARSGGARGLKAEPTRDEDQPHAPAWSAGSRRDRIVMKPRPECGAGRASSSASPASETLGERIVRMAWAATAMHLAAAATGEIDGRRVDGRAGAPPSADGSGGGAAAYDARAEARGAQAARHQSAPAPELESERQAGEQPGSAFDAPINRSETMR